MQAQDKGFAGLRVLSLESRRSREMAELIARNGGQAVVAPSTKEVPIGKNPEVASFASELLNGRVDCVIFLTGVGTRLLVQEAETSCSREQFLDALRRTAVVARGPKPVSVLRELQIPITLTVPEPNTWREILETLDKNKSAVPLEKRRVAVQEYGVSSPELVKGLEQRGAEVIPVPVYQWALPDDSGPLQKAVSALLSHEIDVVLFTASVQLRHLLLTAENMKARSDLIAALKQTVVASIGPVTSAELRQEGISPDVEPTHPKMGFMVKESAERAVQLLPKKKISIAGI